MKPNVFLAVVISVIITLFSIATYKTIDAHHRHEESVYYGTIVHPKVWNDSDNDSLIKPKYKDLGNGWRAVGGE